MALWHLLSLDAPTVAALWTWFVARALHVPLSAAVPVAMFLAVWLLYAADRLLDTRPSARARHSERSEEPLSFARTPQELEPRHLFHDRHRRHFLAAILVAALALTPLIPAISQPSLRLYLILAATLLLWFVVIHRLARDKPLPKELVPGPFFAAAVFIPSAFAAKPFLVLSAALFALLCIQNCLYIYSWEHDSTASAHPATRLGLRILKPLTLATATLPLALVPVASACAPILLAIAAASALLLLLDRLRLRLDPTDLRAAADLVLLTPLLVLPWLR